MSYEEINKNNENPTIDGEELDVFDVDEFADELADSLSESISDALSDLAIDAVGLVGNAVDNVFEDIENSVESRFEKIEQQLDDCYITTAICKDSGKPDDCYELSMFRAFRDKWLVNQPYGKALIQKYYETAPNIVAKINQRSDSHRIYQQLKQKYLAPCLKHIEQGQFDECKKIYCDMVYGLYNVFGI